MKKLKNYFYLFVLSFAVASFFVIISNHTNKTASASSIASNFYNVVTINYQGEVLGSENIVSEEDGITYIYCNGAVSFNINPFTNNYTSVTFSSDDIFTTTQDSITVSSSDNSFEFQGTTYYFSINGGTGILNIYATDTLTSSAMATTNVSNNNILWYTTDTEENTITIHYTYIYTLLSDAPDSYISIKTSDGSRNRDNSLIETENILYVLRPKVEFSNASNEIVEFSTYSDSTTLLEENDTLKKEQTFEQVKIEFINDSYTKENPLYFSINFNGFTYDYKLYSENLYLFVEYYDDNNSSNNKTLATDLDSQFYINADDNNFYLLFTETGRYSFEIYDSTYVCNMPNPNYYSTSFYIVDSGDEVTTFDNIYIIAQILDDDGNEIEYIVSNSTLNNNVYVTIKNLTNLAEQETFDDVISKLEIIKVMLTGSNNTPSTTTYQASEILEMIDENGDLNILFDSDAYYEIHIYSKDNSKTKDYTFTLVKLAKTSFTIEYDDLKRSHEATIPYYTEQIHYEHQIPSEMYLCYQFTNLTITADNETYSFNKSYMNEFDVYYGMEQVNIVKTVTLTIDENGNEVEEENETSITLEFYGVGDLTVTVEINDTISTYYLNYENGEYTLTFTEYGTYYVTLVDSMGSTTSGTFTLSKSLSTSAIILIVLVCIIFAFIAVFIIRIRASIKTR